MAALAVNDVFKFVQFVSNKEHRGWISPEEFNIAAEVAQLSLYSELEGLYAKTKQIHADLRPFQYEVTGLTDEDSLPSNFRILISAIVNGDTIPIKEVEDQELPDILNSSIVAPTAAYPIICVKEDEFAVYPTDTTFDISCLIAPTAPKWDYTISASGRPVYSAASGIDAPSVDFGFDETLFMNISMRILELVGINIGKEEITQYALASKQKA